MLKPTPPQSSKRKAPAKPREDWISIRLLQLVNVLFTRLYHRLTIVTPLKISLTEPALIVCNHISSLDPLFVQAGCPRRLIIWMMAGEYMSLPVLGRVFKILGVIPVNRTGRDSGSLRSALRELSNGHVLGVFPEGQIAPTDDLQVLHTGAAQLAIKTKARIYPAYQDGSQRRTSMLHAFIHPQTAYLAFGGPVEIDYSNSSKENLEAATAQIATAIMELKKKVLQRRMRDKLNIGN